MSAVTKSHNKAVLRWWAWRYYLRLWWQPVVLCLLLCVFICGRYIVWPLYIQHDVQASAWHSGDGVVVNVVQGITLKAGSYTGTTVVVRVGGKLLDYQTSMPVRIGEPVRIKYRVGRSGHVYVEGAESVLSRSRQKAITSP